MGLCRVQDRDVYGSMGLCGVQDRDVYGSMGLFYVEFKIGMYMGLCFRASSICMMSGYWDMCETE